MPMASFMESFHYIFDLPLFRPWTGYRVAVLGSSQKRGGAVGTGIGQAFEEIKSPGSSECPWWALEQTWGEAAFQGTLSRLWCVQ